ncbi:sek-3 [Pristionchus pacificus]|uniref:mitogen-activated protein kinase kinase n=1 Tax=Pristionchus pacificus TaxID=54126 RepID=A0A454XQF1_PRIPA|nr:sek-3 [Pristionchus pacificus]|eukprot:PDM65840.1 sek-3 [Pristionchus pacificus]
MGIRLSKRRRSNTRRPSTLRIDGALRTSSNGASSSTPRRPLNLIASGPSSSVPRRPSSSASSTTSYRSCCSLESFYSLPTTPLPDLDEIYNAYVQKEISNKLHFVEEEPEHAFTTADLKDHGFIGEGMYGKVNKMQFKPTGKMMAVKRVRIISNRNDDHDTNTSMKQVKNEINAIRSASKCDEIVQFYGVTFNEGDCWVCMELMDASLEQIYIAVHGPALQWNFFDELVLGSIAVSAIRGLDHLKTQQNIIHRDVKPSNILMNANGRVKLCDFGISGYLVDSVAHTRDVGCRPYMAPERLQAQASYDIRSDVWSLGITMVEICTGKFPYGEMFDMPLFKLIETVVDHDAPLLLDTNYNFKTTMFINSLLIKEVNERPDLKQLMECEYFVYHDELQSLQEHVANFVQKVLPEVEPIPQ